MHLRKFMSVPITVRPYKYVQYVRTFSAHVSVLNETTKTEKRVSVVPEHVKKLTEAGFTVTVVSDAGKASGFTDQAYKDAGARVAESGKDTALFESPHAHKVIASLSPPDKTIPLPSDEVSLMSQFGFSKGEEILQNFNPSGSLNVLNLNQLLRTLSRGQNYDVMSSQANLAGYRSVIEASYLMQRPFAAQSTAAGRLPPSNILVVGTGVAGLAAIQTAKSLGGSVKAFDVRSAAKEQVEAMGAQFLDFQKAAASGDGAGGYAKEMGDDWLKSAQQFLAAPVSQANVVVTTAQVPNKPAPKLITDEMIKSMPENAIIVDLASSTGGNTFLTKLDEVVNTTDPSRTIMGYSVATMASRIPATSSKLYSGNVTNLLLDMSKKTGKFEIDQEDVAVRSMLSINQSKVMPPFVPPAAPAPKKAASKPAKTEVVLTEEEIKNDTLRSAGMMGAAGVAAVGAAAAVPSMGLLSSFVLSTYLGSMSVRGVAHALHSPLMSITNAISGMTIVGGMMQLPHAATVTTITLALGATGLSAVNLTGGFLVTKKMLDMFKRKGDAPEFFHYFLVPPAMVGAGYLAGHAMGMDLAGPVALASGVGCIGGIGLMSKQETSRMAHYVALGGVGLGLTTTLVQMGHLTAGHGVGLLGSVVVGGGAGHVIAGRVGPTQLPQAVAGFHSLVGLAALSTAVNEFIIHSDAFDMGAFQKGSLYAGAFLGSATATGSLIACGKLAEWKWLPQKTLALDNRDTINAAMFGTSMAGMAGFMATGSPALAGGCLATGSTLSGLLGLHMTASIGGADMPVVITLLNSYSGWALCAEGFILDQPLLTIVGALIGSSGAFLTKIMCDGMNRSLSHVILGGYGSTAVSSTANVEYAPHTEIQVEETANLLKDAKKVCIVPGYGLAVAQAQKDLAAIALELTNQGVEVQFAVHPVAGRMPGQLNVLLAEAGVPYDMVFELEDVNPKMEEVDVCLVVGANDTVNSSAVDDPGSAIAGMPVIEVWRAKHVIVSKRSVASGYAGVENPVFYNENTDMLLGSASDTCAKLKVALSN